MNENGWNRRDVLKLGALTGTVVLIASSFPKVAAADWKRVSLNQCLEMAPEDVARSSQVVMDSWDFLKKTAASIRNEELRKRVTNVLENPAPTFTARLQDPVTNRSVREELAARGYWKGVTPEDLLPPIENQEWSPFPFFVAPGSGYQNHHSYPGGLATHTAVNVKVSLALGEVYREIDGLTLDRDSVIAAQILHDQLKPWVFQWGRNGESRTERSLAGTGEHHPLSVAESFHRGLPAEICVAQACAHQHPGRPQEEAEVVAWIQAAAILLGIDPKGKGLLDPSGATVPRPRRIENFICHLGDHDFVISVPAAQWLIPILKTVAIQQYHLREEDLTGKKFNALRNYLFSQMTIMRLYHLYALQGIEGLSKIVTQIIVPA